MKLNVCRFPGRGVIPGYVQRLPHRGLHDDGRTGAHDVGHAIGQVPGELRARTALRNDRGTGSRDVIVAPTRIISPPSVDSPIGRVRARSRLHVLSSTGVR
jgi:hypothetical protein